MEDKGISAPGRQALRLEQRIRVPPGQFPLEAGPVSPVPSYPCAQHRGHAVSGRLEQFHHDQVRW